MFRNTSHNGVSLIQEAIRLRPMDPGIHGIAGEVFYDAKMRKESLAEFALSKKYPGIDDYQISVAKLKVKMSERD